MIRQSHMRKRSGVGELLAAAPQGWKNLKRSAIIGQKSVSILASLVPYVNLTVFVRGYWAPGKRFVDAWTKTSETSQTSQSLFGKLVKRSLRAVFLSCKLNCVV